MDLLTGLPTCFRALVLPLGPWTGQAQWPGLSVFTYFLFCVQNVGRSHSWPCGNPVMRHLPTGAGAHLPMGGGIRIQHHLPMWGPRHGDTEWEEGSWLRSLPEQQKEWGSPRPPSLPLLVLPVGTHGSFLEPWLWLDPHLPTQAPTGKRPCSLIGAPRLAGRASQITAAPHGSGSISWVSCFAREGWLLIKAAALQF